ncbi:MAG TPA: sigma-70 family RNA polymerase sigma factor [Acidimicrobiia bacterium]|jgi:RNA polymerase sigma-70 factor (ECF subfamily)|nr:sigma-70 family RNA polymerase sigma factor [Acidimicrobiia bacterium]
MTDERQRDTELVRRFVDGESRAFDELMRRHEDRVFAVCLRVMGDRELALDATQETFVTVYRKAHLYNDQAAFSTWLYRVAVNTCYDQHRRRARQRTEALPEGMEPADPTAGDAFESVELRPELEVALAAIPVDFRIAVVLSDLEGMALQEIATLLDVPVGTVKSRIFRGRRQLAEALGNRTGPAPRPTNLETE